MLGPSAVLKPTSLPTTTRKTLTGVSEEKPSLVLPADGGSAELESLRPKPVAGGPVDLSLLINLEDDDGGVGDNLVVELIDLYLENGARQLTEIKAAVTENDERSLKKLAHALKGSSLTMGATEVAQVCAEFEQEQIQPTIGIAALAQKLETAFAYADAIFKGERQKRVTPVAA